MLLFTISPTERIALVHRTHPDLYEMKTALLNGILPVYPTGNRFRTLKKPGRENQDYVKRIHCLGNARRVSGERSEEMAAVAVMEKWKCQDFDCRFGSMMS